MNPVQVDDWIEFLLGLETAVGVEATVGQKLGDKEDKVVAESLIWEHNYFSFLSKCILEEEFCDIKLIEKVWQEFCPFW